MKHQCTKCKDSVINGSLMSEGGICYVFCKRCHDLLQHAPTNNLAHFVGEEKRETQVDINMREARERRARGELIWK